MESIEGTRQANNMLKLEPMTGPKPHQTNPPLLNPRNGKWNSTDKYGRVILKQSHVTHVTDMFSDGKPHQSKLMPFIRFIQNHLYISIIYLQHLKV
jgi:hypothetical protein